MAREARWRGARLHVVHVFRRPVAPTYVAPLDLAPLHRLTRDAVEAVRRREMHWAVHGPHGVGRACPRR